VTLAAWDPGHPVDLIAIHDALERLGRIDRELEEIVELRVFAGLALPAVAKAAKISLRTAERRWQLARAWLRADLSKG
jgi:DNA-directed RNA polymerase specialized sigma24 family protein